MAAYPNTPKSLAHTWSYAAIPILTMLVTLFNSILDVNAEESCIPAMALVVSVQGVVELRRAAEKNWHPAVQNSTLCPGDRIRVRQRSRAALRLSNDSMIRLDQKTTLTLAGSGDEKTTLLDMLSGAIHVLTRTPKPFKVKTPYLNAGIEGTEFFIGMEQDQARLVIYEGKVSASNEYGSLILADNESVIVLRNQAPQKVTVVRPIDGVQWALYYPTIINRFDERTADGGELPTLRVSIELYRQGRMTEALAALDNVSVSDRSSRFLTYRAGLLLSVGRVDEAEADIQKTIRLELANSDAYALLAIIAVVQNEKERALNLATTAVELDQASPTARLALSYAQQAQFKIEDALESVKRAVELDPQNALAWARLAELHMSTGYLDRALEAAHQAVKFNPRLSKTQTVLGFSYLTQIDTGAAKVAFAKAIELDQADPMPRLGMGLAKIREGDLEAGRVELEIAVSLDPANSLIRSYLGKAYFEEKRYALASVQFELAKERDPNDPTPWLYDGIMNQTQNRPVEALREIEKSIELNNNRAAYRSRLLLDQDQAARSTSMARIYDDFNFERRALIAATKSLTLDPASHSSHRFLSDTYANIPRHEIARASELLQAQLLQLNNINPVQPRLAATDLNIITGGGPATAFNEFTPLFERNKPQLVASGVVGNNSTLGNETIISGLYGRTSFSLGQFHYETSGFRKNNDIINNNYNAFIQFAATPRFNVQTEIRTRKTENGDLLLDFDPNVFSASNRRELRQNSARIGARFALSPRQDFIASAMYLGSKEELTLHTTQSVAVTPTTKNAGYQAEVQYLLREDLFNVTAGGTTYRLNIDNQRLTDFNVFDNVTCGMGVTVVRSCMNPILPSYTRERNTGYLYANINHISRLSFTLGLSYDSFRDNLDFEVNKFNPKFGLQWDITKDLRLRLAWFETVKPALIANQTLEPTQVAGFNQLFDDANGTKTRRKGIGLDAHISKNVYGGIEVSARDLDVPGFSRPPTIPAFTLSKIEEQQEKLYRAYLYWLPHINWALRGEPVFEQLSRAADPTNNISQIETLSIPLSVNYFNSYGIFAKSTGTYVRQDVQRPNTSLNQGVHDFFLLDATIGYRLPNRRGIFSLEGRNLLDQDFFFRTQSFQVIDPGLPRYTPARTFFVRLTLNF